MANYGDVVRLAVGPPVLRRDLYLVTHPDGVEQVLAGDPDGYSKNTPFYEEIGKKGGHKVRQLIEEGKKAANEAKPAVREDDVPAVGGEVMPAASEE